MEIKPVRKCSKCSCLLLGRQTRFCKPCSYDNELVKQKAKRLRKKIRKMEASLVSQNTPKEE